METKLAATILTTQPNNSSSKHSTKQATTCIPVAQTATSTAAATIISAAMAMAWTVPITTVMFTHVLPSKLVSQSLKDERQFWGWVGFDIPKLVSLIYTNWNIVFVWIDAILKQLNAA
jgi:hypothetical protein